MATDTDIREGLRRVVDLELVYRIEVVRGRARITMTMTSPTCPLADYLKDLVTSAIRQHVPDVMDDDINLEWEIGLGSRWGYAAAVLVATDALMLLLDPIGSFEPIMITDGVSSWSPSSWSCGGSGSSRRGIDTDTRRRPGKRSNAEGRAEARRGGRLSPTRLARRGSRGSSVCPSYCAATLSRCRRQRAMRGSVTI